MQSCCFFVFFSPDLFMKFSNFSKTVHTIFITLAISKCYGKVRVFFRATTLISDRKSHNSDFLGLAVRCLLFNPEGPGSNPCLCALNFLKSFSKQKILTFRQCDSPSPLFGFLRLIFENFLMSPKGPPFIF